MGKKKPQLLPQVHSEDGSIDVDLACVLQFHYNAAKRIPPFCYSKLPFNFSALSGFEPWPDGKKHARNVYAHTREECEEKLKVLIVEMKAEIVEAQRLKDSGEGDGRPTEGKEGS